MHATVSQCVYTVYIIVHTYHTLVIFLLAFRLISFCFCVLIIAGQLRKTGSGYIVGVT